MSNNLVRKFNRNEYKPRRTRSDIGFRPHNPPKTPEAKENYEKYCKK